MNNNFIIINPTEEQFIVYIYKYNASNDIEILDFNREMTDNLVATLQKALIFANLALKDLNFIGVINGPGSYTKIRIGVAAANAIGFALNIPIINISLFSGLICSVKQLLLGRTSGGNNYLVAINNNKGGIFAQAFNAEFTPITAEIDCDFTKIKDFIQKANKLVVLGDGQMLVKENTVQSELEYLTEITKLNSKDLYELAIQKYLEYNKANVTPVAALYIKDPKITRKQ